MSDKNEEVMFEVGVMEHPLTASRLEALANEVARYQQEMTAGMLRVGEGVQSVKDALVSVGPTMKTFQEGVGTIRRKLPERVGAGVERADVAVDPKPAQAAQRVWEQMEVSAYKAKEAIKDAFKMEDLPDLIRSTLGTVEGISEETVEEIAKDFDGLKTSLPRGIDEATERIRQSFEQMMVDASEAYAEMSANADNWLSKNGTAAERIQTNMNRAAKAHHGYADAQREAQERVDQATIKGLRASIQMAKGVAEVGLMSEESAQKFLQSMAMIQGAFDIFEGMADIVEAVSNGWKAVRAASQAAAAASAAAAAAESPRFVQLKMYHAMLVEEAVLAEAAAVANAHLSASRGMGGIPGGATKAVGAKVAGEVASDAAGGVAKKVVGGAATKAAGGAAVSAAASTATGAAGTATAGGAATTAAAAGLVTAVAAAAAAVAAWSVVVWEAGEIITGNAEKQNSVTRRVVETEVSLASSVFRMTGLFEKQGGSVERALGSMSKAIDDAADNLGGEWIKRINILGDIATLASSQAALENAQKKFAKDKIVNDAEYEKENLRRDAANEIVLANQSTQASVLRNSAGSSNFESQSVSITNRLLEAQAKFEEQRKILDDYASGVAIDPDKVAAAREKVAELREEIQSSLAAQKGIAGERGFAKIHTEQEIQVDLAKQLTAQQNEYITLKKENSGDQERINDALAMEKKLMEEITSSQERQRQAASEIASERIAAERAVQDSLKQQLDIQRQQIAAIDSQARSSAVNFARMGDMEKQFAIDAVKQARVSGAASLTDPQRDLLRQVGTAETNRFAEEADLAEAKKFGFNEAFGKSMEMERQAAETARRKIEADIRASYDVTVQFQMDSEKIVREVVAGANEAVRAGNERLKQEIQEELRTKVGEVQQRAQQRELERQKNKG